MPSCSRLLAFFSCLLLLVNAHADKCHNNDPNCDAWIENCAGNSWVRDTCPLTCKVCHNFAARQRELLDNCKDFSDNCHDWVHGDVSLCKSTDYIIRSCKKACGLCGSLPRQYDVKQLPSSLQPVAFLVGKWRSEHGGKAIFPTIPVFTYGEELSFALSDDKQNGLPALNYTAFAWGINEKNELHSEYGFVVVRPGSKEVALNTVMNNGFVTVEEGKVEGNGIKFRLQDIGRISFSRDLPVHDVVRHWTLLDRDTLEARLEMETLTHGMQEHTFIRYKKIFP